MTEPKAFLRRGGELLPLSAIYVGVEGGNDVYELLGESFMPGDRLHIEYMPAHTTFRLLGPVAA